MLTLTSEQKIQFFQSHEHLPSIEDSLWLIVRGVARTYSINPEGNMITLGYWGDGDVVSKYLSNVRPYTIEAVTELEAVSVPAEQFHQLSTAIIRHGQQTTQLMYILRSSRVRKRLLLFLESLANKFGYVVSKGKLIDLRLTHQELADVLGTTRITVTKTLNQLEQENLISRSRERNIILHHLFSS